MSERITAQVSEMTSNMLDRIFSIHVGLESRDASRQAVRTEVMKEIGVELQRFQKKYEESRELIYSMRKNFLKEIQHLKAIDTMGGAKQRPG